MSILSLLNNDTIGTLKEVMNEGNIMKPSLNGVFRGIQNIHLQVASKWSTEFECWLLDRSLPNDILGCVPDSPCRIPIRVEKIQVIVHHLPWWKLQVGECFSCRANLFEGESMKIATVVSKHDMWRVGQLVMNQPISMAHLFAGAFNGWHQAERFSHFHRKLPECNWSLNIDDDPMVCEMASKNLTAERITNNRAVPEDWPIQCCILQSKVEDLSWMKFVQSPVNLMWTVSFPCQPFSRGGNGAGVQTKEGQSIFHVLAAARVMQPIAVLLENVDTFPTHIHAPLVLRFCIWAGYRLVWSNVSDMADMAPHHRARWLAVLIRQDLNQSPHSIVAKLPCLQQVSWKHPSFAFSIPAAMKDQLTLNQELIICYGNWNLLPKGMGKGSPHQNLHQNLQARIPAVDSKLGTLVARYSQQHLLPMNHVTKSGLFAQLIMDENGKYSFMDPILWHSLMGNLYTIFLHKDMAVVFHQLGNGLAVPQACLTMFTALQILGLTQPEFSIEDAIVDVWNSKLTANQSMCIECEGGYAIMTPDDFLMLTPLVRSIECFVNVATSFTIIWPDLNRSVIEWSRSLTVAQLLQWCAFPIHISALWGIWIEPTNVIISGNDVFPPGSVCGKFVFLPETHLQRSSPIQTEKTIDEVEITDTCVWTQPPKSSDVSDELTSISVKLPDGTTREIECNPMRIIEEVAVLAGFTGDINNLEAWKGGEKLTLDCIVRPLQKAHIVFSIKQKRKSPEPMEHNIVLEIVSLAGTTKFIPSNRDTTIRQSLIDAGFSIEFIERLSATCDGKLISLDVTVGTLRFPAIRLCAFPLKGGAPTASKGKENMPDPFQKNDPWGPYNEKAGRSVRWEELKLPSNHPWFGKDGKRLNLVTVLQLGPQLGGVAFATKASVATLMLSNPHPQTVVLVPGLKGLGQLDARIQKMALHPKEIVVEEPGTNKMYKRLVIPIIFGEGIEFKHENTDKTVQITSAKFAELVIECHSKILPPGTRQGFAEKPLEAFQRLITGAGISMQEVTIYAFRQIKLQEAPVFQAMIKAPEQARLSLLRWSGSVEAFIRQFVQHDQELDHSILPRYWQISADELRMAKQLGETLEGSFMGIALTGKGLAIRAANNDLKKARAAILHSDSRFNESNGHVICRKIWIAQGFPFAISHDAVIQAILSGTSKAAIPLRSYKNAGMVSWVLGFQDDPLVQSFTIKISDCVHEVLLTPQSQMSQPKGKSKTSLPRQGKQGKVQNTWANAASVQQSNPAINTQINSSENERRIGELEKKMTSLESKHVQLSDKVDGRFDEVSDQLRLILGAVAPNIAKTKVQAPTGESPPSKQQKSM